NATVGAASLVAIVAGALPHELPPLQAPTSLAAPAVAAGAPGATSRLTAAEAAFERHAAARRLADLLIHGPAIDRLGASTASEQHAPLLPHHAAAAAAATGIHLRRALIVAATAAEAAEETTAFDETVSTSAALLAAAHTVAKALRGTHSGSPTGRVGWSARAFWGALLGASQSTDDNDPPHVKFSAAVLVVDGLKQIAAVGCLQEHDDDSDLSGDDASAELSGEEFRRFRVDNECLRSLLDEVEDQVEL
ncbi:hypothetical protein HK405_014398, partial [Cladochytrium tenue]